jgi:aminomethyltransferase
MRTPLYDFHCARGAKMVPFAGYEMPIHYAQGILKEHLHTRAQAGLFDTSHMGQIAVRPRSGTLQSVALALERVLPVDVASLQPGRQRYAFFTNDAGGILDDLMIVHRGDSLLLIVNAAGKIADERHLVAELGSECEIEFEDRALIALQGPQAEAALADLAPGCWQMRFMDVQPATLLGHDCLLMRSGYSGEDGFEISIPNVAACSIVERLLDVPNVALIGLGARDSLRLEAGLCLYGADLNPDTTPVEAALEWAIQRTRRDGGGRAGGFPGASKILHQIEHGAPRRRVGFRPEGRAPVRAGASIFTDLTDETPAGVVTSGGYGPTVRAPIAMGYLATAASHAGTRVFAEVRGERLPMHITDLPFIQPRYKRT